MKYSNFSTRLNRIKTFHWQAKVYAEKTDCEFKTEEFLQLTDDCCHIVCTTCTTGLYALWDYITQMPNNFQSWFSLIWQTVSSHYTTKHKQPTLHVCVQSCPQCDSIDTSLALQFSRTCKYPDQKKNTAARWLLPFLHWRRSTNVKYLRLRWPPIVYSFLYHN